MILGVGLQCIGRATLENGSKSNQDFDVTSAVAASKFRVSLL
jgi:hypothetical protein